MKATGMVRRIDELGRMVIPKEIRRVLKIREGDPLEIFTNAEGQIILSKYSPMNDLSHMAQGIADSINASLRHTVMICDRDQIIAVAGNLKNFMGQNISEALKSAFEARTFSLRNQSERVIPLLSSQEDTSYACQAIAPILSEGEVAGGVILLSQRQGTVFGEIESKILELTASLLARQLLI